ncbi:mitochondrial import receptor subunit TOM40 homolog isoform X1 [Drosophila gunungcola]|uniref:mitochondrial import receptor subunit TOM40 homolog isoform X1 n=1 Tax=Drosophila gunungcola TaxID=103775 RepID=UPI0022DF7068|nr:mitochondrial import receptor subunit TOM40 homolog isoform X1 [Drosophila gunungcola]
MMSKLNITIIFLSCVLLAIANGQHYQYQQYPYNNRQYHYPQPRPVQNRSPYGVRTLGNVQSSQDEFPPVLGPPPDAGLPPVLGPPPGVELPPKGGPLGFGPPLSSGGCNVCGGPNVLAGNKKDRFG